MHGNVANVQPKNLNATEPIKLIELRNYLIKPGRRDEFINYFEQNFIQSQNERGGYILGQYRVKGAQDNFFWIRGFKDMSSRSRFLNEFYRGAFWKEHRNVPNSLLLNNDNVYLLKPLAINDSVAETEHGFDPAWFGKEKGIAVVDFLISNTKLEKLIAFVKNHYAAVLKDAGVETTSFWISETSPNDFTALPVFQDKNLLVQISFYKDEAAYRVKMKAVDAKMTEEEKADMADLVTVRNTLIIYPAKKSFSLPTSKNDRVKKATR